MIKHDKQLLYPLLWLCLWLLSLLAFSAWASTSNTLVNEDSSEDKRSWKFDVFLDDSKIGYHHFSREHIDGFEYITSEAEFEVRFMFFTVYHYRHNNTEQWRNDCLVNLESSTDDNGDEQFVTLNRNNQKNQIITSKTKVTTNDCIRSFAYWNLSQLDASPLLNSQTGELMDVSLHKLGKETLQTQQPPIKTTRYQLVGDDIKIDLWYTQDNQWLALQSTTENGSLIRYQLKSDTSQGTSGQSAP
jgi:hypothetical protein